MVKNECPWSKNNNQGGQFQAGKKPATPAPMKRKSVGLCALTLTIFFSAASLVHANEPDYLKNYPGPASAILRSLGLNDDARARGCGDCGRARC